MRWLFLLLILINLAVYLWGVQQENARNARQVIAPPGMGNLRMLPPERDPAQENLPAADADASAVQSPPATAQVVSQETGEKSRDGAPIASTTPEPSAQMTAAVTTAPNSARVLEQPETAPEGVWQCARLGPFEKEEQSKSVGDRLRRAGLTVEEQTTSAQKSIGYWVIVPPLESESESIAMVRRIREAGVKDVGRFYKGDDKNGISLGVFSREENASMRQKEMAAKGFETEILHRTTRVVRYWIDYRYQQGDTIPDIGQIIADFPTAGQSKKTCESIAKP